MQPLPGFRDFYPEDFALRHYLAQTWRTCALQAGFVEVEGPPLEPLELYQKKSGEELLGQLYQFTDKGERHVALRPEMTPTIARMVGSRHRDFKKPIKWFCLPQLFRYERQQKGRLREHIQFNADLFGEASLEAEIELLALLLNTLRRLGLQPSDIVLRLSDRRFWTDFLTQHHVPEDRWYDFFQAIDKSEREPIDKTQERLGSLAQPVLHIFQHGAPSDRLDHVLAGLQARGLADYAQVDLRIVRGLAYYTGVVFEVFDRSGEFRAIAGGGRYDDLLTKLGFEPLPALGFGMGDVVLGELLKARNLLPSLAPALDCYLLIADEAHRPLAHRLLQQLRDLGHSADLPLSPAPYKKQQQAAEARGARLLLLLDEAVAAGNLTLKHLATRQQQTVPIDQLPHALHSLLHPA